MSIELAKFGALCDRLTRIDFFGEGGFRPPWRYPPTPEAVLRAIEGGAADLPPSYRNGYAAPLMANIQHALLQTAGQLEPYAAVVYQYAQGSPVAEPLHRFLAVISDLYRSFLDKSKRAGLDLPLVTQLPPLALFESASGGIGPYTITSDDVWNLTTSNIGLVSLPSKYQDHPLVWAVLAHETGGHDVLHADYALLSELKQGVWRELGARPPDVDSAPEITPEQLSGLVWSHWMDEAASDVYGLLNIGPEFAISLAAYFSALSVVSRGRGTQAAHPFLGVDCLEENFYRQKFQLEAHPPDVLRLHLAIGVIGSLSSLDQAKRDAYIRDIQTLSESAAADPQSVRRLTLRGYASFLREDDSSIAWYPVRAYLKLADMRESARRIGAYIATTLLHALGNNSIQKIETWDNKDETAAGKIADSLKREMRVDGMGDDAQLLAGANAAVLDRPDLYDPVSRLLELALDRSFREDPIWRPVYPSPPSSSFSAPRRVVTPRRLQVGEPPSAGQGNGV